jgi:hypothetical protein
LLSLTLFSVYKALGRRGIFAMGTWSINFPSNMPGSEKTVAEEFGSIAEVFLGMVQDKGYHSKQNGC